MGAARKLYVADLFCGAGGTSTGVAQACKELDLTVELLAINHWDTAIATHTKNHPWARHLCANLDTIDPRKVIPGGHLDLLVASPECTHHSVARGGKPINDQSRASAFRVLEWCDKLHVSNVLIENVPEFVNWGPIGANGRPLKSKVGETFRHWKRMLEGMNYRVEHKVLNAADFGGATTRKRLFVIARKGSARINWPEQTHAKDADKTGDIFRKLKPWRAAREIIDWSIEGESIFTRKRPLARTTLERIAAGLRKFCGPAAEPFLVILRRHMDGKSIDEPIPCLTASGQHVGLAVPKPFVLQQQSGGVPRSVDEPLPTIAGSGAQAFIVPFYGEREGQQPRTHSVDAPLATQPTNPKFGLAQPFRVGAGGPTNGGRPKSIEKPVDGILTENHKALVEPFIFSMEHGKKPDAFIAPTNHGKDDRTHSVEKPMPTVTTVDAWAVVEPTLVKFYGDPDKNNQPVSVPLSTVTTKDRFGLVEPGQTQVGIDIRFRMLRPHELAAAMGFEKYQFTGSREQQVKQIGNAVEVNTAKALVKAILE